MPKLNNENLHEIQTILEENVDKNLNEGTYINLCDLMKNLYLDNKQLYKVEYQDIDVFPQINEYDDDDEYETGTIIMSICRRFTITNIQERTLNDFKSYPECFHLGCYTLDNCCNCNKHSIDNRVYRLHNSHKIYSIKKLE